MNQSPAPFPGGASYNGFGQLWHPPIATKWIFTALIVFAGSVANRIPIQIRKVFTHPLGFFLTALVAISIYQMVSLQLHLLYSFSYYRYGLLRQVVRQRDI